MYVYKNIIIFIIINMNYLYKKINQLDGYTI